MITRRGFLSGILATTIAPAIVRSESIMKIWVPSQELVIVSAIPWQGTMQELAQISFARMITKLIPNGDAPLFKLYNK